MAVATGAGKVFDWLSSMTAVAGLVTWFGITVTYLRFYEGLKAHGIDRTTLPFYTRFQPYAAWYGCCATFIICFVSSLSIFPREVALTCLQFSGWSVFLKGHWNTATFVTNYLPFILFPILYIGGLFYYRTPPISPADMDFVSDLDQIAADEVDEPPPKNKIEAFWQWLVSIYLCHVET